uniref:Uncharacterized protein n=1 Tax=Sphaerodactylus townsendi TaxID=933632 RepID=A0ACB8EFI0_9SAUR
MQRLVGEDDAQVSCGEEMNLQSEKPEENDLNGTLGSEVKGMPEILEVCGNQQGLESCGQVNPVEEDSILGAISCELMFSSVFEGQLDLVQ